MGLPEGIRRDLLARRHTALLLAIVSLFAVRPFLGDTAAGAIYKAIHGVLLGGLIQNPISFAYTSGDSRPLSTLLIQPIVLKQLWRGLYVKSADATWTIGERAGTATLLPLSLGLGYVIPREGSAPINLFVTGEWMAYRDHAPVAPQTTVRLGLTIAFPDWTRWQGF